MDCKSPFLKNRKERCVSLLIPDSEFFPAPVLADSLRPLPLQRCNRVHLLQRKPNTLSGILSQISVAQVVPD